MSALYIGLISGTSIDGIDAALVDFSNTQPALLATHSQVIPAPTTERIKQLCTPNTSASEIEDLGMLDIALGKLFAEAVNQLLKISGKSASDIIAIGSHGQTVRHRPPDQTQANGFTLQIADPNIIAENTGITTVADFRRRDMACGGQGAPFAPAFHQAIAPTNIDNCIFLNLGGIANISVIQQGKLISGYDTGPANGLMDAWIQQHKHLPFDKSGEWAAQGEANSELLATLLTDQYFSLPAPKSTGREYFNLDWLEKARVQGVKITNTPADQLNPQNVQATLLALTAQSISDELAKHQPSVVYCCGGGVHNKALMARLKALNEAITILDTSALGIAPDWIEAAAFAWLAKKHIHSEPIDLTTVTGASKPCVLGAMISGCK
jgi:anhydro-N-acetylmuramic acid kinase